MNEINTNPDGSYMSEDQILADLPNRVTDQETLALIQNNFSPPMKYDGYDDMYSALERDILGRWIRNSYGLWREDNPYTAIDPEPNKDGILDHPLHPDNLSGRIIDKFVKKLQYDEAVKRLLDTTKERLNAATEEMLSAPEIKAYLQRTSNEIYQRLSAEKNLTT